MGVCCVDGCDADDNEDITYFPFPIKPTLRKKWRDAIKTTSKLHVDSKVCSKHFNRSDYEEIRGKLRLKGRVVPTLFHNDQNGSTPPESGKSKTLPSPGNSPKSPQSPAKGPESPSKGPDTPSKSPDRSESRNEDAEEIITAPDFDLATLTNGDDSAENCTIECVPEAVLDHESDSHSETDLHKEDIEDIIANYHIKQNKRVVERLKAAQEREIRQGTDCQGTVVSQETDRTREGQVTEKSKMDLHNQEKQGESSKPLTKHQEYRPHKSKRDSKKERRMKKRTAVAAEGEVIEVEDDDTAQKDPVFIEICVDAASNKEPSSEGTSTATQGDCMLLLENVEVHIDPSTLMLDPEPEENKKDDPISLLTSSDEDDVIIQEPHIDTVEVSDEDEDDMPLVKLVTDSWQESKQEALGQIFWGNVYEYYCYQCHFKTTKIGEFRTHKQTHSKVINVCEICNFATASNYQYAKHKKKHKEEKRFKCHLCDYKAKHNMSLVYHLKSHGSAKSNLNPDMTKVAKFKCACGFKTKSKVNLSRHRRNCRKTKIMECDDCGYTTKSKSDFARHNHRHRLLSVDEDDDD